eukprot:8533594-Ditylum_brightwellii.AAC.1
MLVYEKERDQLLMYFRGILDRLKHYHTTVNLQKCKWFQDHCEFIGIDVDQGSNYPARSKQDVFWAIAPPIAWADPWMFIGMFGFYSKQLPLYKLQIIPWRTVLANKPKPDKLSQLKGVRLIRRLWMEECQNILNQLKPDVKT